MPFESNATHLRLRCRNVRPGADPPRFVILLVRRDGGRSTISPRTAAAFATTTFATDKECSSTARERDIRHRRLLLMLKFIVLVKWYSTSELALTIALFKGNLGVHNLDTTILNGDHLEETKIEPKIDSFDHLETWKLGCRFF